MDYRGKNVLIIIHQGDLGGAERQGLGLSKVLTEKYSCEVNVLLTFSGEVSSNFEEFASECHVKNILFFEKPYLLCKKEFTFRNLKRAVWSFKYLKRMRKNLLPYKPEILIPFLNFPSKVSYFLYKILPSAKVTFWHQLGLDSINKDLFEYIAVNNIPFVIANAENGLEIFRNVYKIDPIKLNVLPQYLSLKPCPSAQNNSLRAELGIPEHSIVIGMVAHYRPEKLHSLLLNAFKQVKEGFPDTHLVFLGNKNQTETSITKYNTLASFINENYLSNSVHLLSDIPVQRVLSSIDIGVLVSEIEGVPNAVMEYMSYGLPVIATKHPGCISLLKDSKFLISNDQVQLQQCLEEFIQSKELRQIEGEKNLSLIKPYTMEAYMEKLEMITDKYF